MNNIYQQYNNQVLNEEWYNIPSRCNIIKCPHIDRTYECNMGCKLLNKRINKVEKNLTNIKKILKIYCPNYLYLNIIEVINK